MDGFLNLLDDQPPPAGLTLDQRRFVDGFLSLSTPARPDEDPAAEFRRVVMDRWELLTWRAHGAIASRFAQVEPGRLRLLGLLERTPPLLAPLDRSRDEVTHSKLLAWALERPGRWGRALRLAFLHVIGEERSPDGWRVETERWLSKESRVDVDITIPGAWRCMIEMKVDAQEGTKQLRRYHELLTVACDELEMDGTLVFLTLDGREGETREAHTPLSFRRLLGAWLPLAAEAEPDALFLRLWLTSVARDFCGLGAATPVSAWTFSQRVAALDFLEEIGELDA